MPLSADTPSTPHYRLLVSGTVVHTWTVSVRSVVSEIQSGESVFAATTNNGYFFDF